MRNILTLAAVLVLSALYAESPKEAEVVLRDFITHVPDLGSYLALIATGRTPAPPESDPARYQTAVSRSRS